MAEMNQQPQGVAYRPVARQHIMQFGTSTIQLGGRDPLRLNSVGMLAGILLHFKATLTLSNAGAFGFGGPWGFISRLRVVLNSGTTLVDVSGLGAWVVTSQMLRGCFNPGNNDLAAATSNAGANNIEFPLFLPIALNDSIQSELGLVNLQANDVECRLEIQYANNGADIVSNFTSIVGNVTAAYVYYDALDARFVQQPPPVVIQLLEDSRPITATGDQQYEIPKGGTLLQLMEIVTLNNAICDLRLGQATSNNITSIRLRANRTEMVYEMPARIAALWQAFKQGTDGGLGLGIHWNFLDSGVTGVGEGDFRDTIDTERISTLEVFTNIAQGANVGAIARIDYIRRIAQGLTL